MKIATQAVGPILLSLCAIAAQAQTPLLQVTLAPQTDPARSRIDAVDVTIRVDGMGVAAGAPLLQMPLVIHNVETVATTLQGLSANDAHGALPLSVRDDSAGANGFNRHWIADRRAEGTLTVRYRAPISARPAPLGAAPPTELRSDGLSVSAGGATFLMLPETKVTYQVALQWDLSGLPAGHVALSSLGPGDASSDRLLSSEEVGRLFFMAGLIGRFPQSLPAAGFLSAWQGTPPFDARALMEWTARLYDHYVIFFKEEDRLPYAVFLRPNNVNPGGGISQEHSFVATFDEHTVVRDLKLTLAHEMLHTFIGGLNGDEQLDEGWFSEGLAVYYQRTLPVRFGALSLEDFLLDLNETAARYYTNALASTPNAEIPARFWSNTLIRVLPYDRGALYFATVNDAVRKASGGKRSLDDLVIELLQRRRKEGKIQRSDWEEVISGAVGPVGLSGFRAMLEGKEVLPASDAFGACLRRTRRPLRRYELGFDPAVMAERQRIVRGLVTGSAAERAGLRNGDEIVKPFGQDAVQADQSGMLTVEVRRAGQELSISYLPRGETVPAYQWERIPGIASSRCVP